MARFGFCNGVGSYRSQSPNVDAESCINLYPESIESGWGKSANALYYTPGFSLFCTLGGVSVRGFIGISTAGQTIERVFAVSGPWFYELFSDGSFTIRNPSNLFTGTGIASMAASPTQILIVDGGQAYCFSLNTNLFQALQTYTPGAGQIANPVSIVAGGQGYSPGDVVTPSASGTGGTFTVGAVTALTGGAIIPAGTTLLLGGSGYNLGDTATPVQGGASGGLFTVTGINSTPPGEITSAVLNHAGTGYTLNDVLTVVQGGASGGQVKVAGIVPTSGGAIFGAIPSAGFAGVNYHIGDTINLSGVSGSGGQLRVTGVLGTGAVTGLGVISAGSGYSTTNNVVTTGGSGSFLQVNISATAIMSGVVSSISLNAPGTGYSTATGLGVTGGTGLGLTTNIVATSALAGAVTSFNVTATGSGYSTASPIATSGGSGTGFTVNLGATAIAGGAVTSIVLTTPGSGYSPASGVPGATMTGGTGVGLQLNYSTTSLTPGSGMIANPVQCAQIDGFFIVLQGNSQVIQVSQPEDASAWDPTQVAQVSVFADNVVGMLSAYRQLWLWGSRESQVYYDSGNVFPFDIVPGAFIEQGLIAINSPVRLDNSVFWIGRDERGSAIAWRANGYTPTRVSNHAVEWEWQGYETVSDAIGYAWQYSGHSFWRIYFPTAQKTWEYDAATNQWHQVESWNPATQLYGPHFSQCHIFAFGTHLIGDWNTGNIYSMSENEYTDNGQAIRRVRISPYIFREAQWIYHSKLQIDVEVGLGPQPPLVDGDGNPRQPQLSASWSDDQAKTWGNEHILDCGQRVSSKQESCSISWAGVAEGFTG